MPASDSSISLLLKAATPELYRRNAFRLTGLPVTASIREVARQADKLKMLADLGGQAAQHLAVIPGMAPPKAEEVREATQRLKDVEARALDEFFWFWPEDWEKPDADEAFAAVKRNDLDAAFAIWAQREAEVKSFIASRNLALIFHMRALEWAHLDFVEPLPFGRVVKVASYWKDAFDRWEWLADDDRFWDAFKMRIRQVNDPALTTGFARRLRSELPQAFDKINAELALIYAGQGRYVETQWHVDFLKSTHAGSDDVSATLDVVLASVFSRLGRLVETAVKAANEKKSEGMTHASALIDSAVPVLNIIDAFHADNSAESTHHFDEVAQGALVCALGAYKAFNDSRNATEVRSAYAIQMHQEFIQVLKRCKFQAISTDLRQRLEGYENDAKTNLVFDQTVKPLVELIMAIKDSSGTAVQKLNRMGKEIFPRVDALISAGTLPKEMSNDICDSTAAVVRSLGIEANNTDGMPGVALQAMNTATRYARDGKLKAQLEQDRQVSEANKEAKKHKTSSSGCCVLMCFLCSFAVMSVLLLCMIWNLIAAPPTNSFTAIPAQFSLTITTSNRP